MSKKLWLGFIAGAAAGAIVGILLAPDKGANTRNRLARNMKARVKELKDSLSSLGETHRDPLDIFEWEHAERPFTGYLVEDRV